nr:hypothetical protein [Tepidimonas fonticaldi]
MQIHEFVELAEQDRWVVFVGPQRADHPGKIAADLDHPLLGVGLAHGLDVALWPVRLWQRQVDDRQNERAHHGFLPWAKP